MIIFDNSLIRKVLDRGFFAAVPGNGIVLICFEINEVMRKLSTIIILLFTFCLSVTAQNKPSADSTKQWLADLAKIKDDNARLKTLIKLGSYYLYKPGEFKRDLDSADLFLNQARELSAKSGLLEIQNKVTYLKAEVLFERGDQPKSRVVYMNAIDNYMQAGDKAGAANVWRSMAARIMYSNDSTEMLGLRGFEHALRLYTELGDKENEAGVLKYMGDRLLQQGKLDDAEHELLKALSIFKSIGYKKLHYTYDLLAAISNIRGDFNKALYYSLEMIKSVQASGDTARVYNLYLRLSAVYDNLKEYDKSSYWYNKALVAGAKNPMLFYDLNNFFIMGMISDHKEKQALEFLKKLIKTRPPSSDSERFSVSSRFAECYSLMRRDDLAEKHYQQAIVFAKKTLYGYDDLVAYKQMGDFYMSRKRYEPAGIYLEKALAVPRGIGDVETIRNTYLELFKTDSATGKYLSAIKNYQQYKLLTDSIFTVAKAKQITQLQLQFEKDQKVQQLEDKGRLQRAELQHAATVKNFTIAGAGLLCLFLIMGYRRYRQKQHSNQLLRAQQKEISTINQSLQLTVAEKDTLLKEKDTLLTEKDWLLKEVHHRVKNNLHMVSCLLESQAIYLENDALAAIESSQHRIYAMSLIHQKLYQSGDIKVIDMYLYIKEFAEYLADSFGPPANINIRSVIEPLDLGVSQAIPLGLILNEAVTNAFKYAFPDSRDGEIFIGLSKTSKKIELVIADDGIGFKQQVDKSEPAHTLGMELMKGLTQDLKGNITFDTDAGTRIAIVFAEDSLDGTRLTSINSKHSFLKYDN